jgi:aspartate/methionine/tyrosine aminotransferase
MTSTMMKKLDAVREQQTFPSELGFYHDCSGGPQIKQAVARILGTRVFGLGDPVDTGRIIVGNGCSSIVEATTFALCDPGDGILLPTPWYAGFANDTGTRARAKLLPVSTSAKNNFLVTVDELEAAYNTSEKAGVRVRMLLLANPTNPMGNIFSKQHLQDIIQWCDSKPGLHLLLDEIYAMTRLDTSDDSDCDTFISVANIMGGETGDRVHICHGFSKDFGLSGFRCGVFYTCNSELHGALAAQSIFFSVSGDSEFVLSGMLSDDDFLDKYFADNTTQLTLAYQKVKGVLNKFNIPFIKPAAAFYVWVNMQQFLTSDTQEAEHVLWSRILDDASINVTPGQACMSSTHGWFRICYAAVTPLALTIAMSRLSKCLEQIQSEKANQSSE